MSAYWTNETSFEGVERIPVTLDNLKRVTALVLNKKTGTMTLLIEAEPGSDNAMTAVDLIKAIDDNDAGLEGVVGYGGIRTLASFLYQLHERQKSFVRKVDTDDVLVWRRADYFCRLIDAGLTKA